MFNAIVFFGLFGVVPAFNRTDEIQNVIDGLFIPPSASRPAVQHIYSRVAVRGAVSWIRYFRIYALRLANAFTSDCLGESSQIFTALIIRRLHTA